MLRFMHKERAQTTAIKVDVYKERKRHHINETSLIWQNRAWAQNLYMFQEETNMLATRDMFVYLLLVTA